MKSNLFLTIKKRKNFLQLRKAKNSLIGEVIIINFKNINSCDDLSLGFTVSKKHGNAVKRNKIKRRLRNIINEAVNKIPLKFNYSYLVIAKPTMLNNEYTIIKETLFRNLESIN